MGQGREQGREGREGGGSEEEEGRGKEKGGGGEEEEQETPDILIHTDVHARGTGPLIKTDVHARNGRPLINIDVCARSAGPLINTGRHANRLVLCGRLAVVTYIACTNVSQNLLGVTWGHEVLF